MKTLLRVVLSVLGVLVLVGLIAYADGRTLPVNHVASVSGTVNAPPAKVFAIMSDVASGPSWRSEVKGVQMLPRNEGRDAWMEDYGSGQKMQLVTLSSTPPAETGQAVRVVETKEPSYGGTWTYDIAPGSSPNTSTLTITEHGYINPPLYRFMMAHIFGPTKNLKDYLKDMQAAASKG